MIKDKLFQLQEGNVRLEGIFDEKIWQINNNLLKKVNLTKAVDFFRNQTCDFAAGEFWGKLMRASCLIYKYTKDEQLKAIIDNTVDDLLSVQKSNGCLSVFTYDKQPLNSDLWDRKYALLGLLSYYDITHSEIALNAAKKLLDYTISQVGHAPKVEITDTGWAFFGIESSSILEPVMKMYNIIKDKSYLDFAHYIVEEAGACKRENIFEAILSGKNPKDVGNNGIPEESIAKAYEMMSCFEGLIEYYRATGIEKYKTAVKMFIEKVVDQEITLIGSGGADRPYNLGPGSGEQWNFTAYEQTNPNITKMNETCVTVTWIKLCLQYLRLTGDSLIVDQMEKSIYNAILGAIKYTGDNFEYYPKLNGTRSSDVGFSYNLGDFPLSCCTANGPSGLGLVPFISVMAEEEGVVINLFISGEYKVNLNNNTEVIVIIKTNYPTDSKVVIEVKSDLNNRFTVKVRIPHWSKDTRLFVEDNRKPVEAGTYAEIINEGCMISKKIELELDMACRVIKAKKGVTENSDGFIALARGPIILAKDVRLSNNLEETVDIKADTVNILPKKSKIKSIIQCEVHSLSESFDVIDYSSAGSTWDENSRFRVWLPKKGTIANNSSN